MGIVKSDAIMLLDAKKRGVNFSKLATLGHQKWYVMEHDMKKFNSKYGLNISNLEDYKFRDYADLFFEKVLGASSVMSIDNSQYQGVDILHDMNYPISTDYDKQFDVVIDGGVLEHIFNFPMAIKNCMRMVKVGGSIFITGPANNYLGHGFYQFSPELFFRIFQEKYGFEVVRVVLYDFPYVGAETSSRQIMYDVADPAQVHQRVCLVNSKPVIISVEARRISDKPIFEEFPIQSDYVELWDKYGKKELPVNTQQKNTFKNSLRLLLQKLPRSIRHVVFGNIYKVKYSFWNREFYKRIKQ